MKDISTLIQIDSKGRPHVAGRRKITVALIGIMHITHGETIPEISEGYGLAPEEIYAALAYYYANIGEITAMIEEEGRYVAQFVRDNPDIILKTIN